MDDKQLGEFKECVIRECQRWIADTPVILLGSGASAPFGLPTMPDLGKSIIDAVETNIQNIADDERWKDFKRDIKSIGLEPALQKGALKGRQEIYQLIVSTAWVEVASKDALVGELVLHNYDTLPLTKLLSHLFSSDLRRVDVVTTNYDRLVEYAVGAGSFIYRTGFDPGYIGAWRGSSATLHYYFNPPPSALPARVVNIHKVHGSLDWFKKSDTEAIYALPARSCPPKDFVQLIVPPGLTKYQEALQEPFRTIITRADRALDNATGFFSVGYGFNDDHIHTKLLNRVKKHKKPLVVLAKTLTQKTRDILFNENNAVRFIALEEHQNGTNIYTTDHKEGITIEGLDLWNFQHFVNEVL